MVRRQEDERISRNVSFLISILVRYSEISTVKYDPRDRTIRFTVLVNQIEGVDKSVNRLNEALSLFNHLQQRAPETLAVGQESLGEMVSFSVIRDIYTLTAEEIYTAVEFLRQEFPDKVVADPLNQAFLEEEWWVQEELIEEMLRGLGRGRTARNLLAFREDGRVILFQK